MKNQNKTKKSTHMWLPVRSIVQLIAPISDLNGLFANLNDFYINCLVGSTVY